MININYLPIESVLSEIYRDYGKDIDEGTLIEWIGRALENISVSTLSLEKRTAFINVINFQCSLPKDCVNVIQIAKNNLESITYEIADTIPDITFYDSDGNEIDISGSTGALPYVETYYSSGFWSANIIRERFTPVTLNKSSFFMQIITDPKGNFSYEYTFVDSNTLRFSFQEGQILVAYLKRVTDKEGIPMIPDHPVILEAINAYVVRNIVRKDYFNHVQGSEGRYETARKEWIIARERAKSVAILPASVDEYERLVKNNTRLVRPSDRFDDFFDGNYSNYPNYTRDQIYYR